MKNQVIDKRILGGAKRQSRALVVLTMMLALVMNAKAQQKPAEGQPMEQREQSDAGISSAESRQRSNVVQQKRMMEFQVIKNRIVTRDD